MPAHNMDSQKSESCDFEGDKQTQVLLLGKMDSQLNFVKISGALSAISVLMGVTCLLHTVLHSGGSAQSDPWQAGGVHKLPAMHVVPQSRRLLTRRLGNSTPDFSNLDDSNEHSGVGVIEYAMDKAAYMATLQLYNHGFESFQYDKGGHHTQHVDITGRDDFVLFEDESVALSVEHLDGKIRFQVMVFCPDSSIAEAEECRIVVPDLHMVEGTRRLSTAVVAPPQQNDGQALAAMVSMLQMTMQAMQRTIERQSDLIERQSEQISALINESTAAREQLSQAQSQLVEAQAEVSQTSDVAPVQEVHYHTHNDVDSDNDNGDEDHSCFPLDTMVLLAGASLPIQDAKVGMQLLTSQGLSTFFLQGHADPDAETQMMQIDTLSNHSVTATFDHYFPLVSGAHMAAQRLSLGDELWVHQDGSMVPSSIVNIQVVVAKGLFNPYTLAGDIIVNGILASSHSSWFLEGTGMSDDTIVAVYKALFSPLILLHHLKPSAFLCFHEEIGTKGALDEVGASKLISQAASCLMGSLMVKSSMF